MNTCATPAAPASPACVTACTDPADRAAATEASAWPAEQSFCTQLSFALERPAPVAAPCPRPTSPAADLETAARIAGTYTVSYNAASGLLALSGTLNVDGATYFVDDQLTIDRAASFEAYLSASGNDNGDRRLTAWSAGGLPEQGPALQLLAGLAVMAHLGLKRQPA